MDTHIQISGHTSGGMNDVWLRLTIGDNFGWTSQSFIMRREEVIELRDRLNKELERSAAIAKARGEEGKKIQADKK